MKKRVLAFVLVLCMVLTMTPMVAFADEYVDVDDHWAEGPISRWTLEGVINGYNGAFNPNGLMKRGEAAQLIVNLCGLTGTADLSMYTDLDEDDWHASALAACVDAGIMNGTSATTMDPEGFISREMLFVMIGRAVGVQPAEKLEVPFPDADEISPYAQGMIYALANAGYIKGMNGEIEPGTDINRASVVALLDQTIVHRVTESGTVNVDTDGIVLVMADDVTITGNAGSVVVAQGAEDATVTLKDVEVKNAVVVNGENANVVLEGKTTAAQVVVNAADTKLEVSGTTEVANVAVTETASNANVAVDKEAKVENLDSKADNVAIGGAGTVANATVSGNNNKVDTAGTKVEVAEGTTGTTANNNAVAGGTTTTTEPSAPAAGGSGGGGGGGNKPAGGNTGNTTSGKTSGTSGTSGTSNAGTPDKNNQEADNGDTK